MLVQARLKNSDLAVLTTQLSLIISVSTTKPLALHWFALLLDEAAQPTDAKALIPWTFLQPGSEPLEGFHYFPQVIMAGNEHQLGHRISEHRGDGLQKTVFQCIFERHLYSDHVLSSKNSSEPLTAALLSMFPLPLVNLVRNYRSRTAIHKSRHCPSNMIP